MRAAEEAAVRALAEGMRELAVNLPDGSRLAVALAKEARRCDLMGGGPEPAAAKFGLSSFVRDL